MYPYFQNYFSYYKFICPLKGEYSILCNCCLVTRKIITLATKMSGLKYALTKVVFSSTNHVRHALIQLGKFNNNRN